MTELSGVIYLQNGNAGPMQGDDGAALALTAGIFLWKSFKAAL